MRNLVRRLPWSEADASHIELLLTREWLVKGMFICPKCKTESVRTRHYKANLHSQNVIGKMMKIKEIIDFCDKCNHFIYKEDV